MRGTKAYYGGVGNRVEFTHTDGAGAFAGGTDGIIDRAIADLKLWHKDNSLVLVSGFSRGGMNAILFAERAKEEGITIDYLSLWDPVFSNGLPGNQSNGVKVSPEGKAGNYVWKRLPSNVIDVTVVYAQHEVRTWFPATRLTSSSQTEVDEIISPGTHSEVGGGWYANQLLADMSFYAMVSRVKSFVSVHERVGFG